MKKSIKTLLILFINAMLVCSSININVSAAEASEETTTEAATTEQKASNDPETIKQYDEKDGVASIRLMYSADSGAKDIIKTGYAFFIGGNDENEHVYMISCCDTVILTDKEKKKVASSHGVEVNEVKTVIELVLKDDVIVELSVVNSSEGMNFAILQPSTQLSSCTSVRLCSDTSKTKKGDKVRSYDTQLQEVTCQIEDWSEIDNAHYYRYSADKEIEKGMPLFNSDGEVIAIASETNKGKANEYYALQIDEVIDVLDVLGVKYNPEIVVDVTNAETIVSEYEALEKSKYTEETWKECEAAYDVLVSIMNDVANNNVTSYTQNELEAASQDLKNKIDNLKKAEIPVKTVIIIASIVCGVLLIVIIVLIILLIVKTKKYKKMLKEEENRSIMAKEALKLSGRITPGYVQNNSNAPINRSLSEAGNFQMDAGETSVLGADPAYQSGYLGGYGVPVYPTVVRFKTGESFTIRQNSFVIGTAADTVDYCVLYNNSISRKHACIMKFEDGYYIQDLETTNGTFVNGVRVMPGRYTKLEPGCIIKLAEEEFEFKG